MTSLSSFIANAALTDRDLRPAALYVCVIPPDLLDDQPALDAYKAHVTVRFLAGIGYPVTDDLRSAVRFVAVDATEARTLVDRARSVGWLRLDLDAAISRYGDDPLPCVLVAYIPPAIPPGPPAPISMPQSRGTANLPKETL